jgi:hypothetical protein
MCHVYETQKMRDAEYQCVKCGTGPCFDCFEEYDTKLEITRTVQASLCPKISTSEVS